MNKMEHQTMGMGEVDAASIRERRMALGWSQAELGRRAGGVTQQAVHQLESGISKFSRYRDAILKALEDGENDRVPASGLSISATQPSSFSHSLLPTRSPAPHAAPTAKPSIIPPNGWLAVFASKDVGDGMFQLSIDPVEHRPVPRYLEMISGAYGVYVPTRTMEPRYEIGEVAEVVADQPIRPGIDVLLYRAEPDPSTGERVTQLRRLVEFNETHWTVRQFNPEATYQLSRAEWPVAHAVVGRGRPAV